MWGRLPYCTSTAPAASCAAFGRKGKGPGEIGYLAAMYRCGDRLLTNDIDGSRVTVFTLVGAVEREFRFQSPQSVAPYRSACNGSGTFVHYGWDMGNENRGLSQERPILAFIRRRIRATPYRAAPGLGALGNKGRRGTPSPGA